MTSEPALQQLQFQPAIGCNEHRRKLRVTYILGSLCDGGTERQALELLKHLDREWFTLSLILFQDNGVKKVPETVHSHIVLDIPQESSKWLPGLFLWAKAIRKIHSQFLEWRPDVVHAFLPGPSILGVIPARLARVPLFIGSRRSLVEDYRRGRSLATLADVLAFRLAHLNLGNSSAVSEEMILSGGCPRNKCQTIYNGVDTVHLHPGASRTWRTAMGWNDTHVVFGMVANFYAYKRHMDFVKAATLVLKNHAQARFVMVGADYGQKEIIGNEVSRLDLSSKIQILNSDPFPERILSGIDVLVCTSETEGFSNVLLEAMACGKPVIATDVGGNPEIVLHRKTGFLVPPYSPEAVAHVAEELISNPGLRLDLGLQARNRVVEHFSLQTMVHSHEQLYLHRTVESRLRTA